MLYLVYVDESGSLSLKDGQYYTISGVIMNEFDTQYIEETINNFKSTHFNTKDIEIHTHDIWRGTKAFEDFEEWKRKAALCDLYELIRWFPITIISVIINKRRLNDASFAKWNVLNAAWTFMIERFDMYLDSNGQKGLFIVDSNMKRPDKEIHDIIVCLRKDGTFYHRVHHVLEQPLFRNSIDSIGLQIADSVSYAVYKSRLGHYFEDFYDRCIYLHFRRNAYGEVWGFGLKEFPT